MREKTPAAWFTCFQPQPGAKVRLFCFPHAGGGISGFRAWSQRLPSSVEVCAVQLPGRDSRMLEAPCGDCTALVEALARGLAPALDVPFAFFGHSMGSLLAFELIRYLRRQGGPTAAHLFASGRRAPQIPIHEAPCHHLPDASFVDAIIERYNGIPPVILAEPDLMKLFLPILRSDMKLTETYRFVPEEPLNIPITAMAGLSDPLVSALELERWKELTHGPFTMNRLPGDHFYLQNAPPAMLQFIARHLGV